LLGLKLYLKFSKHRYALCEYERIFLCVKVFDVMKTYIVLVGR